LKNCYCQRIASRHSLADALKGRSSRANLRNQNLPLATSRDSSSSSLRDVSMSWRFSYSLRIHCVLRKYQFLSLPSLNLNPRCSASLSARGTMGAITRLRPLGTSSDVACDFLEIAYLQCSRVFRPPPRRCASLEMRAMPINRAGTTQAIVSSKIFIRQRATSIFFYS